MGQIAFLFAGQGAQHPGMGQSLYETSAAAKALFDEAEGMRPGTIEQCFSAPKETLGITENTQPCLFTVNCACAAALAEKGVHADMAAGFSLGELSAIAYAGVLPFAQAFSLVMERARLMQAASIAYPGAMAAVLKLSARQVEELCAQIDGVYPVNYNCPGQTVVSGTQKGIDALVEAVAAAKGKAMKLAVSGSFHTPFMAEAGEGLLEAMEGLAFAPPRIPLYANVNAAPYGDPVALLSAQVQSPVRWEDSIRNMLLAGVDTFIECGPGTTLTGFMRKIAPEARALQVEDAPSLAKTLAALEEQ